MSRSVRRSDCTELRALSNPPEAVKRTAAAVLALLGMIGTIDVRNEKDPRMWKFFRTKLIQASGNDSLLQCMATFDVKNVKPEHVQMANRLLQGLTVEKVRAVSMAACSFFIWASHFIQAAES